MKRMTYFVIALALVLGLSQCKKEQPATPQNGQVRITLNVENGGNNGSRVNVNPTTSPMVTFEKGDKILVGYNGAYVGTLTHNGTYFEGSINATQSDEDQPLYFYFLGNKTPNFNLDNSGCTVSISDQTNELPVLSMGESIDRSTGETVYYSSEISTYEAQLHNQCALVKFPLAANAGSIKIGGMKNEATIDFASSSINPTGNTGDVRLYSISDTEKWAILLPQDAVSNAAVTIGSQNLTVDVPAIAANALLNESISEIPNTSTIIGLATVDSDITVEDGAILTGTLGANVQISIADGATVTLDGVSINGENYENYSWAGITCLGNATIILKDGSENTVRGFNEDYPGIYVPKNYTLTIQGGAAGTGKLTASSNGNGAGIGGGLYIPCGNIEIQGGVITATGGSSAAGIGSGQEANCGTITISGGTVTATGGSSAAGIGSGVEADCGDITITTGVTSVTATKGSSASNSIGAVKFGTCGTVTIGCTLDGDGNPVGGTVYPDGISDSPYTYQPQ